jgi:effector-binding domain-containing protein
MLNLCEAHEQTAQPILSIRTRLSVQDLPDVLGESYGKIMQHLAEIGQNPAGAPFVAYYNMDMQDLDMEAGFPVAQALPGKDEIKAGNLPAGMVATCEYTGPYPEMGAAYEELTQWIKDNGYEATGVSYEFYLNDPAQTPPQDLRTRIVFPLKPKI